VAGKPKGSRPDMDLELGIVRKLGGPVIGIDEAGRGPLAGPVVAAAVLFDAGTVEGGLPAALAGLDDSKKITEEKREALHDIIMAHFDVAIGIADVSRIDRDNILQATLWAMQQASAGVRGKPVAALVDGNRAPVLPCRCQVVVRGDSRCLSIAAASVVAKVSRDRMMRALGKRHPEYGFETHKGYGTAAHLAAIARHGVIAAHRRSFRPVRLALGLETEEV
jgi:ribonuclease HII